jgi:PAS domain S-box-containing protein
MPDFKEEARIIRELTRAENGPDPFSSAVRSTRMPMLITDPRQPDNPIVFANAAFSRLTSYSRRDIIGQNCRFLQARETDQTDIARLRAAIEARETIELDLLNYKADGSTFWNRLLVSPVFDDEGQLTYFFASQFDVTLEMERLVQLLKDREGLEAEVAHRNADLVASEQRLRLALEAGRLGTWSIDLDTGHLSASAACKANCGWPRDEPFTLDQLRGLIHPEDRQLHTDAISEAVETGHLLDIEYRLILKDSFERWVQLRGQANYRADSSPVLMVGTTQDVTERRNVQAHKAMLATEMNHRLKNTLASMQAIITQTLRNASTLEDAAMSIKSRIRAVADGNDLLISGRFEGGTIPQLLEKALTPFGVSDTG